MRETDDWIDIREAFCRALELVGRPKRTRKMFEKALVSGALAARAAISIVEYDIGDLSPEPRPLEDKTVVKRNERPGRYTIICPPFWKELRPSRVPFVVCDWENFVFASRDMPEQQILKFDKNLNSVVAPAAKRSVMYDVEVDRLQFDKMIEPFVTSEDSKFAAAEANRMIRLQRTRFKWTELLANYYEKAEQGVLHRDFGFFRNGDGSQAELEKKIWLLTGQRSSEATCRRQAKKLIRLNSARMTK